MSKYIDTKHSELTPQENIFDRIPTLSLKELLLGYLQESTIEGKDTVLSNSAVLKTTKDK